METPEPGGTTRGRPREEVEWMRRVSDITLWRLPTLLVENQRKSWPSERRGDAY